MKLQQKIKLSFLLVFSLLGIGAFAQSTKNAHQKVLFENINSFQQYANSNVYLKCGNEENLIFEFDTSACIKTNIEGESEERFSYDKGMIIYQPYGEYVPGSYYSETKIELLDVEEIIFSLQVLVVGNRYEYYECNEIYYFQLNGNKWERVVY